MSNHFTYEIDERNLRIQLKEFVLPVSEDAWQKFETFSDSMVSQQRENRYKFNLNLNRNVVLPSVFGVIIILFSFLLVNFVSIKNPVKESAHKAEAAATPEPQPVVKEIKKEEPKVVKASVVTAPAAAPTQEIKPVEVPVAQTAPVVKEEAPVIASETLTDVASAEVKAEAEAKAKRRAKRRAEAIETQQLNEIRPTIVSEERDSEIRPN